VLIVPARRPDDCQSFGLSRTMFKMLITMKRDVLKVPSSQE